jgi:hypothetical protein
MKGKLRLKRIHAVWMMLALVCVPIVGKAMSADLELDDQSSRLDDTVIFTMSVNNAPNDVSSLGMEISYAPAVLEYVGDAGDFSGTLMEVWSFKQISNPSPGLLIFGGFTVNGQITAGSSGSLVKLTFNVIGTEGYQLTLSQLKDNIDGWNTKDGTFTYLILTITSISPDIGSTTGGQEVTIIGENFYETDVTDPTVIFGGVEATNVSVVSSTEITCKTPEHDEGKVDVVVTNPDGKSATLAEGLEYLANLAPIADAGSDQTVSGGVEVTLDGSNSSDPDGTIVSYLWTQTDGSSVTLSDPTVVKPTFTAFDVGADGRALTFQLSVTDDVGLKDKDTCFVNITAEEDDSPCFIATAAFGSPLEAHVK